MDRSEWIVFEVKDTGIGLTEEKMLGLFQDFTQADASTTRKFGGTGLGLALTRRYCQMMGGDVTVRSVPNEGSVFTIKLPAIVKDVVLPAAELTDGSTEAPPAVEQRRSTDPHAAPGTCVLVIDDNPQQRDLMDRFLVKEGYCVRCAASGEEGLRLAKEIHPVAITLDVMMPGMDGWLVLQALRKDPALKTIPVIMLTMVDDPGRGLSLGATDYVTKPVNRQRLSQILKRFACPSPPCPVLVVEDDAQIRGSMRRLLEKNGCRVAEAENGKVALEIMEKDRPSLIFLDLLMPVMDGFEFADTVRTNDDWRSIPIVVVTSHDLSPDERKRLGGSVETVIQKKGRSSEELLGEVRYALDQCAVGRVVPG